MPIHFLRRNLGLGRGNPTLGSPGVIAYPTNGQASKVFHALTDFPNVDWWLFRKFSSDSAVIQQWFSSQVRSWINYVPFGRVGVLLGSSLGQINLEFMTQWATQGWRTIRGWLYLYFGEIYYSFSTNSLFCWSFESIYQDAARPLRLCLWYHLARSTGLGQLVTSHAPVHPHIRSCPPKLPEALFFPIEIR